MINVTRHAPLSYPKGRWRSPLGTCPLMTIVTQHLALRYRLDPRAELCPAEAVLSHHASDSQHLPSGFGISSAKGTLERVFNMKKVKEQG